MSKVKIVYEDGDKEVIIPEPGFVDCLLNVGEVAVDGETYTDVVRVTFHEM